MADGMSGTWKDQVEEMSEKLQILLLRMDCGLGVLGKDGSGRVWLENHSERLRTVMLADAKVLDDEYGS